MALAWFDSQHRGRVGTHPAYRQKGLANAAVLAALHRLQELGALSAIVYAQAACLLYAGKENSLDIAQSGSNHGSPDRWNYRSK